MISDSIATFDHPSEQDSMDKSLEKQSWCSARDQTYKTKTCSHRGCSEISRATNDEERERAYLNCLLDDARFFREAVRRETAQQLAAKTSNVRTLGLIVSCAIQGDGGWMSYDYRKCFSEDCFEELHKEYPPSGKMVDIQGTSEETAEAILQWLSAQS